MQTIDHYINSLHTYNYRTYFIENMPLEVRAEATKDFFSPLLNVEKYGTRPLQRLLNKAHPSRGSKNLKTLSLEQSLKDADYDVRRAEQALRDYNAKSWIDWLLPKDEQKIRSLEFRLAQAVARRDRLPQEFATQESLKSEVAAAKDLIRSYIADWNKVLKRQADVLVLQRQLEQELPFLEVHERAYAKAAALDGKIREDARSVADRIAKTDNCPYCGGPLGAEPHLDHIYPVAKGGLSIVQNLLWACAPCNLKKRDMGLIEFLSAARLDVLAVITRLRLMGKTV